MERNRPHGPKYGCAVTEDKHSKKYRGKVRNWTDVIRIKRHCKKRGVHLEISGIERDGWRRQKLGGIVRDGNEEAQQETERRGHKLESQGQESKNILNNGDGGGA